MGQPAFAFFERSSGAASSRQESAFAELDAIARSSDRAGFVVVRGAPSGSLEALAGHLERRARAAGLRVEKLLGAGVDDAWRELGLRLGVSLGADTLKVAQGIADAARGRVLIVVEGASTKWGATVADEVARAVCGDGHDARVFVLREGAPDRILFGEARADIREITVGRALSAEDARLWWDAVARDPETSLPALDRLEALDGWWAAARSTSSGACPEPPALSEGATALLGRLLLSRRTWLASDAARLGSTGALAELVREGAATLDAAGRVQARLAVAVDAAAHASAVADVLVDIAPHDAWAAARAGELHALAGAHDRAEASMFGAIQRVTDADSRADFWARWEAALHAMPDEGGTGRLLRAAELALRVGDVDRALELARRAAARGGDSYEIMLMLGRATTERGDLSTATHALGRAMERAPTAELRARAAVEMAELCYAAGQLDDARRHAEETLEGATDLSTRLAASNVLGKLLLASASWAEAERHFAADACEATCGADSRGELRARLNRAIALLSSGRRDEAWAMLASVLEDGDRHGDLRATAFALANLATIATQRHEYSRALDLWARSIDALRRLGDKLRLARLIVNLAELRLRLGLVAEAEQALAFGRKACGPGMPAARFAHFSVVAARVHLARGKTLEAATEIAAAIGNAASSSHGSTLGDCHLVAARIALEDGDLTRVERALERAERGVCDAAGRAELSVLRATLARAAGDDFEAQAEGALELAGEAEDDELLREAHVLVHHADVARGASRSAEAHLAAALALRDKVSASLPDDLRASFLARRDLAELARLDAGARRRAASCARCLRDGCSGTCRPETGTQVEPAGSALARMVGQTPAIRALGAAVKKVGRTDATVLVLGESGTGKELVAEAIHEASARKGAPLVKVNCAALVETLLLSELFGHEKGSFTGASARRRGRFELAEGGTIFLDEIGDISPNTQVALLRILQDRTFERVGGVSPIRADVRVVCATHRDLRAMVARGEFREDLYYRLSGVVLELPALRQRIADLPFIAASILQGIAAERKAPAVRLSASALEALARHPWPGNVRELENALRAATLFAEGDVLEVADFTSNVDGLRDLDEPSTLPAGSTRPSARPTAPPRSAAGCGEDAEPVSMPVLTDVAYASVRSGVSLFDMKRQIEHDCIARALTESGGNITKAATLLGMKRPRLSQLVKQYGLGSGSEES